MPETQLFRISSYRNTKLKMKVERVRRYRSPRLMNEHVCEYLNFFLVIFLHRFKDHTWMSGTGVNRISGVNSLIHPAACVMPVLYLVLLRCGEPGLEEESSLLAVSIREALLWSCFPADDSGLFTAPKTLADLGFVGGGVTRVDLEMWPIQQNPKRYSLRDVAELTFPGVKNDFISDGR